MMNNIVNQLPSMLSGDALISALQILPKYNKSICNESVAIRLTELSNLYNIYVPSYMSTEIYSKLYLSLIRSLQKKTSQALIRQQYENYKAIKQQEYTSIIGGSDSFTIIGCSGIGKSAAISRAISVITQNTILHIENPYSKIIPCVVVQCPFDSSVKGFLLEILRKVDETLDSHYYTNAIKSRATTDMLIGSVSQVALNHIGLLIVDEIQNVVNSKNGKNLIGSLTQLINNSGISICMVGTPESSKFFEQAMQLARRTLGLQYNKLYYDDYFKSFCQLVYSYQYVKNYTSITDSIIEWLYEHSNGIISVVISLIHDAQEIAILNGSEKIDFNNLNVAYQTRITLLHNYINPDIIHNSPTTTSIKKKKAKNIIGNKTKTPISPNVVIQENRSIADVIQYAKEHNKGIVSELQKYFQIIEVKI